MSEFDGATLAITGGTGSFGKTFIKTILDKHPEITKIVIFSRLVIYIK